MDAIKQAIIARGSTFEGQWRNFMAFCWNQQTINDATRLCAASGVTFKTAPDNPATNLEGDDALALTGGFGAVDHDVKLPHALLGFHHVKFAATVADRHYLLAQGQVVEELGNTQFQARESDLLTYLGM